MQIIIQSRLVCTFDINQPSIMLVAKQSLREHGIRFIARAIVLMMVCLNVSLSDSSKEREIMIDVGSNGFYCLFMF